MLRGHDCAPFDQRSSFQAIDFGRFAPLNVAAQTAESTTSTRVIYHEVKSDLLACTSVKDCSTLVDEHFGAAILRDAAREVVKTAHSAKKCAHDEFEFEYVQDFSISSLLDVRGAQHARFSSARSRSVTTNS